MLSSTRNILVGMENVQSISNLKHYNSIPTTQRPYWILPWVWTEIFMGSFINMHCLFSPLCHIVDLYSGMTNHGLSLLIYFLHYYYPFPLFIISICICLMFLDEKKFLGTFGGYCQVPGIKSSKSISCIITWTMIVIGTLFYLQIRLLICSTVQTWSQMREQ